MNLVSVRSKSGVWSKAEPVRERETCRDPEEDALARAGTPPEALPGSPDEGVTAVLEELGERIRAYIQEARQEWGDVAMGCVRLEIRLGFIGMVYDKPGGSSSQYEANYDPQQGFVMLSPEGNLVVEPDPDKVYRRFVEVIESIPAQRRETLERKIAEWRSEGLEGARLHILLVNFNSHYKGTRGGQIAPEEMRFATQVLGA